MSTLQDEIKKHEAHLAALRKQATEEAAAASKPASTNGASPDVPVLKECVIDLFILVDQMYHVLGNELMRSTVQKKFDEIAGKLGYVKPAPVQVSHIGHVAPPMTVGAGFQPLPNAPPPLTK